MLISKRNSGLWASLPAFEIGCLPALTPMRTLHTPTCTHSYKHTSLQKQCILFSAVCMASSYTFKAFCPRDAGSTHVCACRVELSPGLICVRGQALSHFIIFSFFFNTAGAPILQSRHWRCKRGETLGAAINAN